MYSVEFYQNQNEQKPVRDFLLSLRPKPRGKVLQRIQILRANLMARQKTSVQVFLEEQLNDPEVAESFNQGLDELRLAVKIAQLRKHRGLTQAQLAARLDTSTPVISRLENQGNCSIRTLKKVAEALDAVVQIDIVSKEDEDAQEMQLSSLG